VGHALVLAAQGDATWPGGKMREEHIQLLATATEIACTAITNEQLAALQDSLNQACDIPARLQWDRKVAAHAEFFNVLADASDDPRAAKVLNHSTLFAHNLMIEVGRSADLIVINSRKRMLAHIRAGDANDASAEMEKHIRILKFMRRLVAGSACETPAAVPER
jgi:DNA-binding FadR family transcriptional regulator